MAQSTLCFRKVDSLMDAYTFSYHYSPYLRVKRYLLRRLPDLQDQQDLLARLVYRAQLVPQVRKAALALKVFKGRAVQAVHKVHRVKLALPERPVLVAPWVPWGRKVSLAQLV